MKNLLCRYTMYVSLRKIQGYTVMLGVSEEGGSRRDKNCKVKDQS